MISSVYWEWDLLLQTIKLGIKLTFIYDGIRILRLLVPHKNIMISAEDLFYWIYATMLIFQLQLKLTDGVLRGCSVLGLMLGMYLYSKVLGERLIFLAEKGSILFKRQLTELRKVFKIKLCKQCNVLKTNRRKDGRKNRAKVKKEAKKTEETEPVGNNRGFHGSNSNAGSSCH